MLKIERLKNDASVQIRPNDKGLLFDRPFKQALIYSFLFHLLVFGLIRVKFIAIYEPTAQLQPVEVAIDAERDEPNGEAVTVTGLEGQNEEEHFAPVVVHYPQEFHPQNLNSQVNGRQDIALSEYPMDKRIEESVADSFSQKIGYPLHFYPLKIECTSSLSKLTVVEDGSQLFKEKNNYSVQRVAKLPIIFFTIEYSAKVSGMSGKIIESKRKKELWDKKLQACADKIIQVMRFAPSNKKTIRGKILITFECSGDEIEEYLHD